MPIYLEDKILVKRLLSGDERAFSQFFDDNFSRLYRFALTRVSNDPHNAREIVQSVLTKSLQKINTYRGESALFTWLCVICRNEIVDWARKNQSYRENIVLTEDLPEIRAVMESLVAPAGTDPTKQYEKHELCRLIQVALDTLPPKYGDALEWKYIEGHSVKEIAERMNLSPQAAQSLLARAKNSFREIYSTLTGSLVSELQARKI